MAKSYMKPKRTFSFSALFSFCFHNHNFPSFFQIWVSRRPTFLRKSRKTIYIQCIHFPLQKINMPNIIWSPRLACSAFHQIWGLTGFVCFNFKMSVSIRKAIWWARSPSPQQHPGSAFSWVRNTGFRNAVCTSSGLHSFRKKTTNQPKHPINSFLLGVGEPLRAGFAALTTSAPRGSRAEPPVPGPARVAAAGSAGRDRGWGVRIYNAVSTSALVAKKKKQKRKIGDIWSIFPAKNNKRIYMIQVLLYNIKQNR